MAYLPTPPTSPTEQRYGAAVGGMACVRAGAVALDVCSVHIAQFEFATPNTLYRPIDAIYAAFLLSAR
jgi:hypothetical protein